VQLNIGDMLMKPHGLQNHVDAVILGNIKLPVEEEIKNTPVLCVTGKNCLNIHSEFGFQFFRMRTESGFTVSTRKTGTSALQPNS
jgi:hypothetical protein